MAAVNLTLFIPRGGMAENSTPKLTGSPVAGGPVGREGKREKNLQFVWFRSAN